MSARPQTKLAMRPMLPADVPLLAEIFRASIEELGADDYSEAQREAWAERPTMRRNSARGLPVS
jgi:putative acetyltransferase